MNKDKEQDKLNQEQKEWELSNKADKEWNDWLKLMHYFQHEMDEGEITQATYENMTNCLMTFKPWIEIKYDK